MSVAREGADVFLFQMMPYAIWGGQQVAIRLAGCVSQVSPSLRRYLAANMAVFWFMTRLFGVSFGVLVLD